jgi:hypothetical protein
MYQTLKKNKKLQTRQKEEKKMRKMVLIFMFCVMGTMVLVAQEYAGASSYYGVMKGTIKGAYVTYSSEDITVTAGYGECNYRYWEISQDIDISMSMEDFFPLTAGEYIYIYIDDSTSSYPTPTIIGSRTAPTWSESHLGWYNGSDRCIGLIWCADRWSFGQFTVQRNGNLIRYIPSEPMASLVSGGTPTGSWITITNTSDYCPVNATAVKVFAYETDSGNVDLTITSYENEPFGPPYILNSYELSCAGYNRGSINGWIQLGASRDISWRGASDDDPQSTYLYLVGFEYER